MSDEPEIIEAIADETGLDDNIQSDEPEVEETPELEEWQLEDAEEDPDPDYTVAGKLYQAVKTKLKGRVADRDETIEAMQGEIERLKAAPVEKTELTRPNADDFEEDGEFQAALETYNDARTAETWERERLKDQQTNAQRQSQAAITEAVDGHYERAETLATENGIKPEIYKDADSRVRKAMDAVAPGMGDMIVDLHISKMGPGSEKVIFNIGRNPAKLDKFTSLMSTDNSGLSASFYLGTLMTKLNPTKPRSQAPDPPPDIQGDANATASGGALKKKYDAAHNKKDFQLAYNIKKQARAADVEVKGW